ncbi:MAG: mechanosensitive ion channel family protein [Planctomycetes bacterium]|nr:mechanosensitive ion channel family protein [Planctomycetota bacterium]
MTVDGTFLYLRRPLHQLFTWLLATTIFGFGFAEAGESAPEQDHARPAILELAPVKTDHPRDTLRSFMQAMDRYVLAQRDGDPAMHRWLQDATRCLDLSQTNLIGREEIARDAARYLKEVIDRVILVDYDRVPDDPTLKRWRLADTEIAIHRIESGERAGEFLFTPDTVARSRDFYERVRNAPLLPGALGGGFAEPWQERYIPPVLKQKILGLAYWQWLLISALIFVGLVVRQIVRFLAFLAKHATARTSARWDDELVSALTGPVTHLGTTGVWFASIHLIGVTGTAYTVITFLIKSAFFINLAYLAYKLAEFLGNQIEHRLKAQRQDINQGLLKLLKQTLKILALVFCLLLGAQNMGMDVASLIAGLGIGGLAFALAAKDTLANFFGSVMIMLDRPFKVGDWIIAKGVEGVVEEIGFRSTRIRTFYNSLISIPNSELVMSNIDNMGVREWRRVRETYSVIYATPPEKIDAFCAAIRQTLQSRPEVKQDAIVVYFNALASSSLDILVNYHIKAENWSQELAIRHEILCDVLRIAQQVGVSFAFPTQTLHIETLRAVHSATATV